jgi:hypothetical protein
MAGAAPPLTASLIAGQPALAGASPVLTGGPYGPPVSALRPQ